MSKTRYCIFNKFFNMNLYTDNKLIEDIEYLKSYIEPYIHITECEILNENYIYVNKDYIEVKCNGQYLLYNECDIILLKRIIIDIFNRYIENKNGFFLHSSSLAYNNQSIVFVGDRCCGKTTTLLDLLDTSKYTFSSNDSTAIYKERNIVYTYGNPCATNIRRNTMLHNESIFKKITFGIGEGGISLEDDKKEYCLENIHLPYKDLIKCLNLEVSPNNKLACIINLISTTKYRFKLEELDLEQFKKIIQRNIITGVNENRPEIEKIVEKNSMDLEDLKNTDVKYFNLYKDNSQNFSKILTKRLVNERIIK